MADPNIPDPTKYVPVNEMNKRIEEAVARALDKSKIGLDSAGSKFSSGVNDYLGSLGGPIGKLSSGFGRLSSALGAVTGTLIQFADRAIESADAVFSMYNTGVVVALDQLTPAAVAFGTNIDGLNKLMTKHAQVVATMGIERTMKLGDTMRTMTRNGTDLGMTTEQASDALLTYTQILGTTGNLQRYTNSQITTNAIQFANALNEAAQATGKNRDQIAQEVKNRLQQNDAALYMATLNDKQREQVIQTSTALQQFNKNSSTAGTVFLDNMIKFQATNSAARLDPAFRNLLAMTGTLEDFATFAREQDPAKQAEMVSAMIEKMAPKAADILPQLGGVNSASAEMLGNILKANMPVMPGEEAGPSPVDAGAAFIKDVTQVIKQGADAANMALNDLAVSAMLTARPMLTELGNFVDLQKGMINKASSGAVTNPITTDDIAAFLKSDFATIAAGGIAGVVGLLSAGGMANAAKTSSAAAAGGAGAIAAEEGVLARLFGRFAKSFGLVVAGEVADQVGDVVQATGYDRTGAAISAGGVIAGDTAAAVAATKGMPGWVKLLAGLGGAGAGVYQEWDNIQTLLGAQSSTAPGATESTTTDITATAQPETFADYMDSIEQQNARLQSQIQVLEAGSIINNNQNKDMLTKLDLLVKQLTLLTDEVSEQTTTLKNAFSRGAGSVYP